MPGPRPPDPGGPQVPPPPDPGPGDPELARLIQRVKDAKDMMRRDPRRKAPRSSVRKDPI
jgi:hypothetical protein